MNKVIDKGFRSCRFVSTIVKHPVCRRLSCSTIRCSLVCASTQFVIAFPDFSDFVILLLPLALFTKAMTVQFIWPFFPRANVPCICRAIYSQLVTFSAQILPFETASSLTNYRPKIWAVEHTSYAMCSLVWVAGKLAHSLQSANQRWTSVTVVPSSCVQYFWTGSEKQSPKTVSEVGGHCWGLHRSQEDNGHR